MENLNKAHKNDVLWPPLAEAVDTMILRTEAGAGGFERTWRLIHIWESLAAVLTGAAVSRLASIASQDAEDVLRKCREQLYGRSWDGMSESFNRFQGALSGSNACRVHILRELSNLNSVESRFLGAVCRFLRADGIELYPLTNSWERVCDVPDSAMSDSTFSVRDTLSHINEFRNRFAHVPFPHDELGDLADGLTVVTDQVFGVDPPPWVTYKKGDQDVESPLNGALLYKTRRLRGCKKERQTPQVESVKFVFPSLERRSPELCEVWEAGPFASVDSSMFRPSILTRLKSEANAVWEFTRFKTERNSVITRECHEWFELLPIPQSTEYVPDSQPEADAAPEKEIGKRIEEGKRLIGSEDFEEAIEVLETVVKELPNYHVGWLKLGYAQRELAMRTRFKFKDEAKRLFDASLESLSAATMHKEPFRKAEAHYERSKSYYQRALYLSETDDVQQKALPDAEEAYQISPDTRYDTWREKLKRYLHARKREGKTEEG